MDNVANISPPAFMVTTKNYFTVHIEWFDALETLKLAGLNCAIEISAKKTDADSWDVLYIGHADCCKYDKLEPATEYQIRARLQCRGEHGPYSAVTTVEMPHEPASAGEVHRLIKSENYYELEKLLSENKINLDVADKMDYTPLMSAVLANHKRIVNLLLSGGANPNTANKLGKTALMLAANKGHIDIMELLMERGADATKRDIHGMNAVYYAVDGEHGSSIRVLAKNGSDVNCEDQDNGWTPLIRLACLANNGNSKVGAALVSCGAKVNARDKHGQTALLHCAFHRNHVDLAKLLLEHGADPEIRNKNNNTAREIARSLENHNFVMLLDIHKSPRKA